MHELGIMFNVIASVEKIARENDVDQVETLVLQVGELSPVVPQYLHACYPAAVDGTLLENTELKIEILPANARCETCGQVYHLLEHPKACPKCSSTQWEILSGREFMIKEIVAC
jgi:hydrogenase nickel incorporation protein HypA/HybF